LPNGWRTALLFKKNRENADVCPFKWKRIKKEEKRMKRIFKRKKVNIF